MSGSAERAFPLAGLLEGVAEDVFDGAELLVDGNEVHLGHFVEERAQVAFSQLHFGPVPLGAFDLQAAHLLAEFSSFLRLVHQKLECEVQLVDCNVFLSGVVLENAGQERLSEVEHRQPKHLGLVPLDPVADGVQSFD